MSASVPMSSLSDEAAVAMREQDLAAVPEKWRAQRAKLARKLVDVLALPAGQINDNERAFAGDILNEVLDHLSTKMVAELTKRLAATLAPPPALMRRLVREPIEVAGPLLSTFKEIPEAVLAEAASVGPAHRSQIVKRLVLSDLVADTLLRYDDVDVALQVLRREELSIPEARIDELVIRAASDPRLRAPLLERVELQPRHGFQLFWFVDSSDRKRVIGRFAIDRTIIQTSLKSMYQEVFPDPEPDETVKGILTLCDRRHRARNKAGETVPMEAVYKTLIAVRAHASDERCSAIGFIAGISAETARRIIYDEGGEPFAILAKSVGVSRAMFAQVVDKAALLRGEDHLGPSFDEHGRERMAATFDTIARDYARTILRYWDWRAAERD